MATINNVLFGVFKQRPEWEGLTKLQKEFFRLFFTRRNLFLTGSAGVGKTYCLKLLFDFLDEINHFYGKTAMTGVAALNIGGSTVHSWAGIGIAEESGMELLTKVSQNKKAVNRIKNSKILAIDEISMCKADLLEKIDIVCQYIRNCERPFGGLQVIFSGDFCQLPPIFSQLEPETFAFESHAWKSAKIAVVHLMEIVRQHDEPHFAKFLNDVRMGIATDFSILAECHNRQFPNDGIKPVRLFCKNYNVDEYNNQQLAKIALPSKIYRSIDDGPAEWKDFLDKNCRAPAVLELKVGAQVMLLTNISVEAGLVNGSVGVVETLAGGLVTVRFQRGSYPVEPFEWAIRQNEAGPTGEMKRVKIAGRKQIPLKLAWAQTIHKSLGTTIDRAEVDVGEAFAEGMVYVSLSRVRNLASLRLKSFNPAKITTNPKCIEFYENVERDNAAHEALLDGLFENE